MKKSKMLLLISAVVMEIAAIIIIVKSFGSGSSPAAGIVFLVIGLMFLIIGVSKKSDNGRYKKEN